MKTFCLQTLGCKVNQYESEQVVAFLRARGMVETTSDRAELRIINSCSVTIQAASQSRQETRRMTRLPVLSNNRLTPRVPDEHPSAEQTGDSATHPMIERPRVLVMGCWATSDKQEAASLPGVDAVLTHQDDFAVELERLLTNWGLPRDRHCATETTPHACAFERPPEATNDIGWMMKAGSGAGESTQDSKSKSLPDVNENSGQRYAPPAESQAPESGRARLQPSRSPLAGLDSAEASPSRRGLPADSSPRGANSLPVLGQGQPGRQRAFLKIQDGCDAHCTYCIIPRLRPTLHSKPIEDAVEEARRLVDAGHVEIVLTGIFLGAYGHPTALRRRQPHGIAPLARLVESLCKQVAGLKRLRLSSIEPGDLTHELLNTLTSHEQIVPHFHLPLQSGSDVLLRRMNRQYGRDDFLHMADRVNAAFDRPALTTDIIVGFPGEDDAAFQQTIDIAQRAGFIHIHAFPYSPRPGTAAARWYGHYVRGPVVNERINQLRALADAQSFRFRSTFVCELAEVIVERSPTVLDRPTLRHGRCERYFPIHFQDANARPGDLLRLRIDHVNPTQTFGSAAR